jgi:hypothetical protein
VPLNHLVAVAEHLGNNWSGHLGADQFSERFTSLLGPDQSGGRAPPAATPYSLFFARLLQAPPIASDANSLQFAIPAGDLCNDAHVDEP